MKTEHCRPMTRAETELVTKRTSHKGSLGVHGFIDEFYQIFKELMSILYKFTQRIPENKVRPNLFYEANETLMPKTKLPQENYRPISLMHMDIKILKKHKQAIPNNIHRGLHILNNCRTSIH